MPQMPKWQQYGVDWENFNKIVNDQMTDLSTESNLSKHLACVTHILKAVAEVNVGKTKLRQTLHGTSRNKINLCTSLQNGLNCQEWTEVGRKTNKALNEARTNSWKGVPEDALINNNKQDM